MPLRTHYETLSVLPNAPIEVIEASYLALSQKWHPDKNNNSIEFEQIVKGLNTAYEVLSNSKKRAMYDELLGITNPFNYLTQVSYSSNSSKNIRHYQDNNTTLTHKQFTQTDETIKPTSHTHQNNTKQNNQTKSNNPFCVVEQINIFNSYLKSLKTCTFKGRATRKEFWIFQGLSYAIIGFLSLFVVRSFNNISYSSNEAKFILFSPLVLFMISYVVSNVCVTVRRLHDIGRSGWWSLLVGLGAIPIIGEIMGVTLFIVMCLPSERQDNIYGRYTKPRKFSEFSKIVFFLVCCALMFLIIKNIYDDKYNFSAFKDEDKSTQSVNTDNKSLDNNVLLVVSEPVITENISNNVVEEKPFVYWYDDPTHPTVILNKKNEEILKAKLLAGLSKNPSNELIKLTEIALEEQLCSKEQRPGKAITAMIENGFFHSDYSYMDGIITLQNKVNLTVFGSTVKSVEGWQHPSEEEKTTYPFHRAPGTSPPEFISVNFNNPNFKMICPKISEDKNNDVTKEVNLSFSNASLK